MTLCPNSAEHIFPQFKLYLTVIGKMFDRKRNFPVIHADRKSVFDTGQVFFSIPFSAKNRNLIRKPAARNGRFRMI